MRDIEELINEQDRLKFELKEVQGQLTSAVVDYKGSLKEALKLRIVKLNFSAPPGLRRWINEG